MPKPTKILVTGAGGFIGHHLVKLLVKQGHQVRGVDIKKPEFESTDAQEFLVMDLRYKDNTDKATEGVEEVYNLAANMGGVGFIETVHAEIMHDNVLIDTQIIESAYRNGVKRLFYSSSACIYPTSNQLNPNNPGLSEFEAYPADPDNEYGWEKLYTERLCYSYYKDFGFETRVARFHNVYGPLGSWQGGREKSPAALCRKVALANDNDEIEIWGDGEQTRSYCFIEDCLKGIITLMRSDIRKPINIGSDQSVSINQLLDIIAEIAGKKVVKTYDLTKPQGVRGRNSDNSLIKYLFDWAPQTPLEVGLAQTYRWIKSQIDSGKLITPNDNNLGNSTQPLKSAASPILRS